MSKSLSDQIQSLTGNIGGIYSESIELTESFLDVATRFADIPGTVVLMSGGDLDCARYHILATHPFLSFSGKGSRLTLTSNHTQIQVNDDPFDILRLLIHLYRPAIPLDAVPVSAGLFGYLAYDLKDCLEDLPRTSVDTLGLPDICFFAPSILLVHDKKENVTRLFIPQREISGKSTLAADMDAFKKTVESPLPQPLGFQGDPAGFKSNFSRSAYMKAIERIIEYIAAGDIYQVNMSQRFDMAFSGDAFSLFRALYEMNPAPFFAYIHGGSHRIVSTSPERFICRTGDRVETRPIKGTRPRGKTPDEDAQYRRELQNSKKDDAELSMIVDLLRNDIGRVCKGGSVHVTEHKRLEAYQNVYHLVSIVEGVFQETKDSVDLLKATFPGGSITGCPKIRTMEIIDELEPVRRHVYTGSIGYLSFHDTMDLSIAIRTATVYNDRIYFSVGGGIVFDSDPADEFDETLHKGHTLMSVFNNRNMPPAPANKGWINGIIDTMDNALIPVSDLGFQYGFGFFETIRVNHGTICYLSEHLERFYRTWQYLFPGHPPDITWEHVIRQVIAENHLSDQIAAVKMMATRGNRDIPPFNHNLVVTARPYTYRLEGKKEQGLNILTYPEPRVTPFADYKTMNYLYYFMAGKWARDRGADEAMILNPDGTVSETNTANILALKGRILVKPQSAHVLSGIMEQPVIDFLINQGYVLEKKPISPDMLLDMDLVLLTNSLIGAVPVLRIDGKSMPIPTHLWLDINQAVLHSNGKNQA